MNIRWRLVILAIQLAVLALLSYSITGRACVAEAWYFAGLLTIVINPQLLEPFYPRPQDVVANSLIVLFLSSIEKKTATGLGWIFLDCFAGIVLVLAVLALALGASRYKGKYIGL